MTLLFDIFGIDRLNDSAFIYFLSSQLNLNYSSLRRSILRWIDSGVRERRDRWLIDLDTKQQIYNLWIEHSQASTYNGNDRCKVKISKMDYIKKYVGIENENIIIEEITNKRGQASYVANHMIFTNTVRSLHHKLAEKGINVSIGSVLNCKPFSITYESAKKMALCLCKICLNTKFLFDPSISRAKRMEM